MPTGRSSGSPCPTSCRTCSASRRCFCCRGNAGKVRQRSQKKVGLSERDDILHLNLKVGPAVAVHVALDDDEARPGGVGDAFETDKSESHGSSFAALASPPSSAIIPKTKSAAPSFVTLSTPVT